MIANLLFLCSLTKTHNLNGDVYKISNPDYNSKQQFPTIYNQINSSMEYFDVYSDPITSRYGDVYWTMMNPVKLPQNIIDRFNNKVIAITGYEMNQVIINNGIETPVPITWAYNHHYLAYLLDKNTQLVKVNHTNQNDHGQFNHGAREFWKVEPNLKRNGIPTSQFFSEGNGGESRQSFHGYPRNTAQLLHSPYYFRIQPMQIDTRNRDPKYINSSVFHPGILPKTSAAPENASYSGLLECPCTTRIHKIINHNYNTVLSNYCKKVILNSTECLHQGLILTQNTSDFINISSNKYPEGCSLYNNNIVFNSGVSNVDCGNSRLTSGITFDNITNITLSLDLNSINNTARLNLTGPADLWYGVAFNAKSMGDLPYAIIVDGHGHVQEYKLANHAAGNRLKSSVNILSNTVTNNIRSIVLERHLNGLNSNYYSFSIQESNIPILNAVGYGANFSYHHYRSGSEIRLISRDNVTCICDDGVSGTINGIPFSKNCASEPTGDLIRQRNPTCFIDLYEGGLECCHHKNILLDQNQIQPKHEMTYQIKFRFWFQDYDQHESLVRLYFQTEAYAGEYDVPKCLEGTPPEDCIHSITARWKARDMVSKSDIGNSTGTKLIYAGPHCHAATCISMELYNGDTGQLICHADGDLGQGRNNVSFDEKGYIRINPCLFGNDPGLLEPPYLSWDTNLVSVKRNNNTYAHYGEMASWQMRGVIV